MKNTFLRKYNKLLAYILAILGIGCAGTTSCAMYGTGVAEYGVPTARFKIHGTVYSEDSIRVPYIRVSEYLDTTYTNAEGVFTLDLYAFPADQDFYLRFEDMDGIENGSWQTKDTTVAFVNPKFKNGDGDWYAGETSKEFNVKLKKKE